MFKKSLFALLLVVALFTVVGSGVASASSVGCIQSSDSCPSVNASTLAAPSSNYLSGYFQSTGAPSTMHVLGFVGQEPDLPQ